MGGDAQGGWPYEWSALARKYIAKGNPFLASIAYGYAKSPCLADDTWRKALDNQVAAYLAAAPGFPVKFERRKIALAYCGASVDLPIHLFSVTGQYHGAPVLIFSGGVDTYKMDCHDMCVTLAQRTGVTVLRFDMPGTAENPIPLSNLGDEMVLALVEEARRLGNGKVAHLGMSFGGNFSAMTGLSGAVDAAIPLAARSTNASRWSTSKACPSGPPTSSATTWASTTSRPPKSSKPHWRRCRGGRCWTGRITHRCSSSTERTIL
jgi:esterase FrsA